MKIFTVGHSTNSLENFIKSLKKTDINLLVDVRSYPGSRYVPWFNKEKLATSLAENGIEYYHMNKLGGRKKSSLHEHFSLVGGWKNKSFLNYASYTLTKEYEEGIKQLMEKASRKQIAILCAESVPWRCHRLLIANTLLAKGVEVYHIINGRLIEHSLNKYGAFATIEDGKVLYPKK